MAPALGLPLAILLSMLGSDAGLLGEAIAQKRLATPRKVFFESADVRCSMYVLICHVLFRYHSPIRQK